MHGQGSRLGFQDLLREATGQALDPAFFEMHLSTRYLGAASLDDAAANR